MDLTFGDGDVLQEQDDCRDGEFTSKRTDELGVDSGLSDVLEASGDGLQDLDWVCSLGRPPMAGVQPCRNSHDQDNKGIPEDRNEEEHPGLARVSLSQLVAEYPDCIQSDWRTG